MARLQINTHVTAAIALSIGSTEHGLIHVSPTAEELGTLTPEERGALAKYVGGTTQLHVRQGGFPGVVTALRAELAKAHAREAERLASLEAEKASYRLMLNALSFHEHGSMPPTFRGDWRSIGVTWSAAPNFGKDDADAKALWARLEERREAEYRKLVLEADAALSYELVDGELAPQIKAVLRAGADRIYVSARFTTPRATEFQERRAAEQQAAERAKAERAARDLRGLIERVGTTDQLERFAEDVLPEAELTAIVNQELFGAVPCPVFEPITEAEVAEACDCNTHDVRFHSSTAAHSDLTAEQYAALKAVRAAQGGALEESTLEIREHVGYDRNRSETNDPEVRRLGVLMTVTFADRKWRREFAL